MKYEVKDGARTLRFDGQKLAHSSSYRLGSARWIEFSLFKTAGGTYILHRVGVSLVFHSSTCSLVRRYGLHEEAGASLSRGAISCSDCQPKLSDPLVFPEEDRHWTLTTENPESVVESLYKEDDSGIKYLTRVAERLLEDAVQHDADLDAAYRIVYIP